MNEWKYLVLLCKITHYNSGKPHSLCFGVNKQTRSSLPGSGGGNLYFGSSPLGKPQNNCQTAAFKRRLWRWSNRDAMRPLCSCSCVLPLCGYLSIPHKPQVLQWNQSCKTLQWRNDCSFWRFKIGVRDVNLPSLFPSRTKWQSSDGVKRGWLLGVLPATSWHPNTRPLCWGLWALFFLQSSNHKTFLYQFPHKMNVWISILKSQLI